MRQQAHSAQRRGLRLALTLGATALASLAFAGVAGAAVIVVQPDNGTGSDNITAAINTANTNSSTSNTLVLEPGTYQPKIGPIVISKNLSMVVDHTLTQPNATGTSGIADVEGQTAATAADTQLFTVNPGVTFQIDGVGISSWGGSGFEGILDNGNVILNNDEAEGGAPTIDISAVGKATVTDSEFDGLAGNVFLLAGGQTQSSLTLQNDSIDQSGGSAIVISATPYTLNITNTLMAFQVQAECEGGGSTNGGPGSIDDDGTCNVAHSDDTTIDSYYPQNALGFGGPTQVTEPDPNGQAPLTGAPANTQTTDLGVAPCPTTDIRFFVNPVVNGVVQCDIGAVTEQGATQQTTPPTCTVTSTNETTTPATQTVALQDSQSGVGPEPLGLASDNETNTAPTYPPPAAASVPSYSVSNEFVSNGTVAFSPLAEPSTSPLVLTASKTTAGTPTMWSFTGSNWAGVAANCH